MSNTIYVTGSKGMVGSRFLELTSKKYKILSPEIDQLDITDGEAVDSFFKKEKPDYLIHLAAFTDVGAAENERGDKNGMCWKINVEGTKNLAEASKKYGTFMIYISTDMVFPGSKENPGPYNEDKKPESNPDKVTWYGYTKGLGEKAVLETLKAGCAVLRIIYPVRAKFEQKLDYIRKPLSLFDQGKLYPMFTDQQVSISFIDEIVQVLEKIVSDKKSGIFHASSKDTTTPHELISYAIEKAKGIKNGVKESSLKEFLRKADNPVRYPMYGGLRVEKTEKELGIKFSTWKQIVDSIISQIST
jgi:dTDP-4-dehydrorhamnose reductase